MFRRFLFILFSAGCMTISQATPPFPQKFEGTWEADNVEHGTITITMTKIEGTRLTGVMLLTGSSQCTEPIPFKGIYSGDSASIEGDAQIICGYSGNIKGRVTRETEAVYTGNFSYTWMGITWARGTFRLSPK